MLYTFSMKKEQIEQKPFTKRNYYDISDTGIAYFCAIIAPYLIMVVAIIFMGLVSSQIEQTVEQMSKSLAYTIISCFFAPVGFVILFFCFNKKRNISFSAVKLKFKLNIWDFVMCFAVALICLFGLQYFIGGFNHLLELGGFQFSSIDLPMDNVGWLILAILLMAVLPAIFEELIFRGIILNGLLSKFNQVSAIFISAAMFAFIHGSIEQLLYQFALGVVLAWLVLRTGSLFSGMLVHFLNNAMVLIMNYIALHYGSINMVYNAWQWVLSVALVFVAAGLIFLIEKFYFKHKNHEIINEDNPVGDEKIKDGKTKQIKDKPYPILLWISMGIAVVLFLFNTLSGFGAL